MATAYKSQTTAPQLKTTVKEQQVGELGCVSRIRQKKSGKEANACGFGLVREGFVEELIFMGLHIF